MIEVELFTDGACRGNPGPGGWAALLRSKGVEKELSGSESQTTNNRMELMGVIMGLAALKKGVSARVYTDSQYVLKGATEWMPSWKQRGWRTADKKPVKNQDLWERLDAEMSRHQLEWQWVKGHAGHVENERVDALANTAIDAMLALELRG